MTKAELIAELNTKYGELLESKLMNENDPPSYGKWYLLVFKALRNESAFNQSVHIVVYDEGGAGEAAYYKDGIPPDKIEYNDTTSAFRQAVEDGIAAKVTAGAIEKGSIREIDEEKKMAIVEVYMLDTGTLYNRLYLCWEDTDEIIQFERIVQQ